MRWVVVLALLVLGAAAIFWQRWRRDEGPPQVTDRQSRQEVVEPADARSRPPPAAVASGPPPEAAPPPVSAESLPPLDASDAFVRTAARELSRHPSFLEWLAQEDLIHLFVVSVDNVAEGRSPWKHFPFLRPKGEFLVSEGESDLRINPSGYRRYDGIADVVSSLDAKGCAELYFRLKPLIESSYHELGYPDQDFEGRLGQAIAEMLAVPVGPEAPALVEQVQRYEFADPELEALSSAQKQLLRMGPRNMQRIQDKLRELALAVGIRPGE